MELESLRYFKETARTLSITETADRLFISQQTLSNHVRRVEDYYNTPLFNRHPRLQLTLAGEEVLKFADQLFSREETLLSVLSDIANSDSGKVTIGVTSPRCNAYLPKVLEKYAAIYPNVKINSIEATNSILEKMVQKNELDFAVCNNTNEHLPSLRTISVHDEPIYFCVSDRLLYQYYPKSEAEQIKLKSLHGADMADFHRLPFMIPTPNNRIGQQILQCFKDANYTPNIYFTSRHNTMMLPLCNQGLSAGFTSQMNLSTWKAQLADDINIFPLYRNGKPITLSIKIICHNQRYLNHFVKHFLQLTEEILSSIGQQNLSTHSPAAPTPSPSGAISTSDLI